MENKEYYPTPKQEYKVLVRCATFNQSKYIEDALNGFAMQQTSFPFVCLVMDDASTDGEQEVIKKWMKHECNMNKAEIIDILTSTIIIVPHKTNLSCTFAFYMLKQNLYGTGRKIYYLNPWREKCKYESVCEGDDYWIDPFKLQKQVNVMENNPEVMLCGTNGVVLWENYTNRAIVFNSFNENRKLSASDIIGQWIFPTAGLFYRTQLFDDWPEWAKQIYSGDLTLVLLALAKGGVYAIKDVACVYRCDKTGHSVSFNTKREVVLKNHIMLYEYYNNYTSQRYKELVLPYLNSLRNELRFIEANKRGYLFALLISPKQFVINVLDKIKRKIADKFVKTTLV